MDAASRIGFTYEDELKKEPRTHSLEEASISDKTSPNFNLWDGRDPKELKEHLPIAISPMEFLVCPEISLPEFSCSHWLRRLGFFVRTQHTREECNLKILLWITIARD